MSELQSDYDYDYGARAGQERRSELNLGVLTLTAGRKRARLEAWFDRRIRKKSWAATIMIIACQIEFRGGRLHFCIEPELNP